MINEITKIKKDMKCMWFVINIILIGQIIIGLILSWMVCVK